ncbi:MAG: hypothetical protein ACFFF4_06660 [Candidatus Thorarchaeota archaeon]
MSRQSTIVAFLQLGTACVYLLFGVVSIGAISLLENVLFVAEAWYGGPYGVNNSEPLSFFVGTILPFALGAIMLLFFYTNLMEIKTSYLMSSFVHFIGIFGILFTSLPVFATYQLAFLDPSPFWRWIEFLQSYDWYLSYLSTLVPIVLLLSFITIIASFDKDLLKDI